MTAVELLSYAFLAFAVAVALPAVVALVAGVYEYVRARRDAMEVEAVVGDFPAVPSTINQKEIKR